MIGERDSESKANLPDQNYALRIRNLKYPVLSVASVSKHDFCCIAYAGLGKEISIAIQTPRTYPRFVQVLSITSPPSNYLLLNSKGYSANAKIRSKIWNIQVFSAAQDQNVHIYSLSFTISPDFDVACEVFSHAYLSGHTDYVRCIALGAEKNTAMIYTGSDDSVVKGWQLDTLEMGRNTRCITYEGHANDVLQLVHRPGLLVSGAKDHSIIIWSPASVSPNKAKYDRGEKIAAIPTGAVVKSLFVTDDSRTILVGGGDGILRVYQKLNSMWTLIFNHACHSAAIEAISFQNQYLITASKDEQCPLALWKINM